MVFMTLLFYCSFVILKKNNVFKILRPRFCLHVNYTQDCYNYTHVNCNNNLLF